MGSGVFDYICLVLLARPRRIWSGWCCSRLLTRLVGVRIPSIVLVLPKTPAFRRRVFVMRIWIGCNFEFNSYHARATPCVNWLLYRSA